MFFDDSRIQMWSQNRYGSVKNEDRKRLLFFHRFLSIFGSIWEPFGAPKRFQKPSKIDEKKDAKNDAKNAPKMLQDKPVLIRNGKRDFTHCLR